jgi:hypothetical protein
MGHGGMSADSGNNGAKTTMTVDAPLREPGLAPHTGGKIAAPTARQPFAQPWPAMDWLASEHAIGDTGDLPGELPARKKIGKYVRGKLWLWPERRHYFLCDLHADADAFAFSLAQCGIVRVVEGAQEHFVLPSQASEAIFVIGGDCLDKGPSNLDLLRSIDRFRRSGAEVVLLAGNHDIRTFAGLHYLGAEDDWRHAHLFARVGKKGIALLMEVFDAYCADDYSGADAWSDDAVRRLLFPGSDWYASFAANAAGRLPAARIAKEQHRIAEKIVEIEQCWLAAGLSLDMLRVAAYTAKDLFCEPDGEFGWLFADMILAHQAGSVLMVHAGVDDQLVGMIDEIGIDGVNTVFRQTMREDLFDLYNGPFGNAFRTKYRNADLALSKGGIRRLHRSGNYAVMHGHRNHIDGQRLTMRGGLLNFECDASVDRHTRQKEGLAGAGGAVALVDPGGFVAAISADFDHTKVFDPAAYGGLSILVGGTHILKYP